MMLSVRASKAGLVIAFADGLRGLVPFADVPEIGSLEEIATLALPNPYEVVVAKRKDETIELPWDFVRNYCDPSYRPRVERVAAKGRIEIGARVRALREAAGLTQEKLASAARIGRVTIARIESGEQFPRYKTLLALADALDRDPADLLVQTVH